MRDQVSHSNKKKDKVIVICVNTMDVQLSLASRITMNTYRWGGDKNSIILISELSRYELHTPAALSPAVSGQQTKGHTAVWAADKGPHGRPGEQTKGHTAGLDSRQRATGPAWTAKSHTAVSGQQTKGHTAGLDSRQRAGLDTVVTKIKYALMFGTEPRTFRSMASQSVYSLNYLGLLTRTFRTKNHWPLTSVMFVYY
jgi:hypothetical protein